MKDNNNRIAGPRARLMKSMIEIVPDAFFYVFFMHNTMIMRKCKNGEQCFLLETRRYDVYHTKETIVFCGFPFYSIRTAEKDGIDDEYGFKNPNNPNISTPYIVLEFIKKYERYYLQYSEKKSDKNLVSKTRNRLINYKKLVKELESIELTGNSKRTEKEKRQTEILFEYLNGFF